METRRHEFAGNIPTSWLEIVLRLVGIKFKENFYKNNCIQTSHNLNILFITKTLHVIEKTRKMSSFVVLTWMSLEESSKPVMTRTSFFIWTVMAVIQSQHLSSSVPNIHAFHLETRCFHVLIERTM